MKKRFPTISRDQIQKGKHIQRTKTLKHRKKMKKKLISHAFFKSSSSCFSRAVLAAYRRSNLYKLQAHHTIMAWLICVHSAGYLSMSHATKKSFGAFSDCNAAFKFFAFSSASIRPHVLPSLNVDHPVLLTFC